MTIEYHFSEGDPHTLRIEGEMTIYHAMEMKECLLNAVSHAGSLQIDLSSVSELDSSGLQLLVMSQKVAQSRQTVMSLVNCSAAVADSINLLDMGCYFGMPASGADNGD